VSVRHNLDHWQLTSCAAIEVEIVKVAEGRRNANVSVRESTTISTLSGSKALDRRLLATSIVAVKLGNFATIPETISGSVDRKKEGKKRRILKVSKTGSGSETATESQEQGR
jgi:hypothetical protein